MEPISQLLEIYYDYEEFHKNKLLINEARRYFKDLLEKGNIVCVFVDGKIVGYVEFWCVTLKQLQRIKEGEKFYPMDEDISRGNFAYVANMFIHEFYRKTWVVKKLVQDFNERIKHCEYICGKRGLRDNTMRIKWRQA